MLYNAWPVGRLPEIFEVAIAGTGHAARYAVTGLTCVSMGIKTKGVWGVDGIDCSADVYFWVDVFFCCLYCWGPGWPYDL